jgi:ABC-2 type transport system ATP-binding protein
MTEMALTAQHLIVIGRGRLIRDTSVDDFIASASRSTVFVRSPDADHLRDLLLDDHVEVPTADMLRWSLDKVDFNAVLADLDTHKSLESGILNAFLQGVVDAAKQHLEDGTPGLLQSLFR